MQHDRTQPQSLQRGAHHKPSQVTLVQEEAVDTTKTPPNSLSFDTIDNGSLSGESQAFGWRAQKGFAVRPQTWKARAECAFGLPTAVISFFPMLFSKIPQHTGKRSKSLMICKIQDIHKKDKIKYLMLSIQYSPWPRNL